VQQRSRDHLVEGRTDPEQVLDRDFRELDLPLQVDVSWSRNSWTEDISRDVGEGLAVVDSRYFASSRAASLKSGCRIDGIVHLGKTLARLLSTRLIRWTGKEVEFEVGSLFDIGAGNLSPYRIIAACPCLECGV